MIMDNLHKWLIVRLALVWLILSVIIGGLVHYVGTARLDGRIVGMAKAETAIYSDEFAAYLSSRSGDALDRFNRKIRSAIEQDNLIVVEFYDAQSQLISEAVKPSASEVEAQLPQHGSGFSQKDIIATDTLVLSGETYLRVFVPIFGGSGTKVGYMEGVYHAPAEVIAQIKRQTYWSLALVVLVIFVTSLALYPLIIRLNRKLMDYSRVLARTNIGMLKVLGSAIAKRDSDTNLHNYRVTLYSVRLGEKLGLPAVSMQGLIKGAFLHDVGKIGITDTILLKPDKLTAEEFEVMKRHVGHGEDIIGSYAWLADAVEVVRCHHERYDGGGYLDGMCGSAIPINARIFAIADVFDALTSRRPYKEPFSFEVSLGIIRESRDNHFDPRITDLFLEHAEALHAEICHEDEDLLHGKLEECIGMYFR